LAALVQYSAALALGAGEFVPDVSVEEFFEMKEATN
jgi:hypothetical protein